MKHFVHPLPSGRLAVAYMVPGTNVAAVVVDFPATRRAAAQGLADRMTQVSEPAPTDPRPEDRRLPPGFYNEP